MGSDCRIGFRAVAAGDLVRVGRTIERVVQRLTINVVAILLVGVDAGVAGRGGDVPRADAAGQLGHQAVGFRIDVVLAAAQVGQVAVNAGRYAESVAWIVGRHQEGTDRADLMGGHARTQCRVTGIAAGREGGRRGFHTVLALEGRCLDIELPVSRQFFDEAGQEVQVRRLRLDLRPRIDEGALVRMQGRETGATARQEGIVGGVLGATSAGWVVQERHQRARNRRQAVDRARGQVGAALRAPVGLGPVLAGTLAEHDLVLMAVLEGGEGGVTVFVQITDAVGYADVRGLPATGLRAAAFGCKRGAAEGLLQDHVDHAGNRVRTVSGRCAVFQDIDAFDGVEGNVGDIDEGALAIIGQRIRRHAVAVDQH